MNAEQFKQLYLPFHPKLYRIAYAFVENKEDAEDIVQETYCKLWAKRNELADIHTPEAFAVTLIKNACLDFLRSPRSSRNKDPLEKVTVTSDVLPSATLEQKETIERVKQLIGQLPQSQRQVLRLRSIDDCSLEEIELLTGFSAVNVRTLLSRARKTIRGQFFKENKL